MPVSWSSNARRVWPWLAAICSGLLYAGCFAPFNLTWLCWVALTPLISAVWFPHEKPRHAWIRNLALGYVAGLSFMVAFANVILVTPVYRLVIEARTHTPRPHFDLTLTMAAIVGVLTFGLRAAQISTPAKPLRVAAVQPNVPQNQKFDPQFT